jgi:hypothetical protein
MFDFSTLSRGCQIIIVVISLLISSFFHPPDTSYLWSAGFDVSSSMLTFPPCICSSKGKRKGKRKNKRVESGYQFNSRLAYGRTALSDNDATNMLHNGIGLYTAPQVSRQK